MAEKIKRHSVYVRPETHEALVEIARQERRTIAEVVDILVGEHLPPFTTDSTTLAGDADKPRPGATARRTPLTPASS